MQSGASQLVLVVKNPSASAGGGKSCGFDPWVRKIPWKKAWQPTTIDWRWSERRSRVKGGSQVGVLERTALCPLK